MRTVRGNKADARRAVEEYREELEARLNGETCDVTVSQYARRFHERRQKAGLLSPLTLDRERIEIKKVCDAFGGCALSDLKATDIEAVYDKMRSNGASASEVHKVQATLSQILRQAVREELIQRNPAEAIRDATRPKPKERRSLTVGQAVGLAQDLKDAERDGRIVAVWLALATGMRRGETLGLEWDDVDLDARRLFVRRQLDSKRHLRAPKSEKSVRNLSVDDGTVAFLTEWRSQVADMFYGGGKVPGSSPVCTNLTGDFLEPNVFGRWRRAWFADHGLGHFEKVVEYTDSQGFRRTHRSGYVGFNFHELRHTQATLLIGSGADIKTVQNRLGHSSAQLTMDIYAHAIAQNDEKAAATIGRLLEDDQ